MSSDTFSRPEIFKHYSRFLATTIARDKLLRLAQFASLVLSWAFARTKINRSTWKRLIQQLSLTRSILRLGKSVDFYWAAWETLRNQPPSTIEGCAMFGRALALACYLIMDTIILPEKMGLLAFRGAKSIQKGAVRCWCAAIMCSLVVQLKTLLFAAKQDRGSKSSSPNKPNAIPQEEIIRRLVTVYAQLWSSKAKVEAGGAMLRRGRRSPTCVI